VQQPTDSILQTFFAALVATLTAFSKAELPVQLPVKFEMMLNRKTADALDLHVPPSIELRLDEVIE
jgi:hypothetical protein